jgi:CO/xanthine dehydrogenase FAD-binding subunit
LLGDDPEAIVVGGGTTVMPRTVSGELNDARAIGLARAGLDYVRLNGAARIGAMTALGTVAELEEWPMLAAAARSVGGWALRSTATVGGNLLVAPPHGDLAPALLALDAEVHLVGAAGSRVVALADAVAEDAVTRPGEVLVEVVVPPASGETSFQRCARRAASAPSVVTVAARVQRADGVVSEARVALGAVGPSVIRASAAEERLVDSPGDRAAIEDAVDAAVAATDPVDDAVASAWYRRKMTAVHVRRALESVLGEA